MSLGNMRSNGVTAVIATCLNPGCGHKADVAVTQLAGETFVPDVGRRMVCTACGGRQIETRPA